MSKAATLRVGATNGTTTHQPGLGGNTVPTTDTRPRTDADQRPTADNHQADEHQADEHQAMDDVIQALLGPNVKEPRFRSWKRLRMFLATRHIDGLGYTLVVRQGDNHNDPPEIDYFPDGNVKLVWEPPEN